MVQNTQIDMKKLWELAKSGTPADEIMNELNIRDMGALKQAMQSLMQEKGETVAVAGLVGDPGLRARYTDKGIRIDPEMLEESVLRPGDAFDVKVEGDKITLVKNPE